MPTPLIGVDIGTSAVRAVELKRARGKLSLHATGQVGLPLGAVSEGEVADPAAVSDALRRLWSEGGFSRAPVVLAASGQRVIIRQAELPAMSGSELRTAVRFEAEQLIPLPAEETELAFRVLGKADGGGTGPVTRVLLAAAHNDVLAGYLEAAAGADLKVEAIDVGALAMLRGVPVADGHPSPDQRDAVVCVGSGLTTVAVAEGRTAAFVRVIPGGGATLTRAVAAGGDERWGALGESDWAAAETAKRQVTGPGSVALMAAAEPVITDIAQSLEFFVGQHPGTRLRKVHLTGGGALASGFLESLSHQLDAPVEAADAFAGIDTTAWDPGILRRMTPVALSAVGLAQWGTQGPAERLSLLPAQILRRRQVRRDLRRSAIAVGGVAVILMASWGAQEVRVTHAQQALSEARSATAAERASVDALAPVNRYFAAVGDRVARDRGALAGSVDWRAVIQRIAAVMPRGTTLTSFQVAPPPAPTTPAPSSSTKAPSGPLVPAAGSTVTMDVTATGDVDAVATWLQAMARVPFLQDPWVASSTAVAATKGVPAGVSFVCTASLTASAPVQHPNLGGMS